MRMAYLGAAALLLSGSSVVGAQTAPTPPAVTTLPPQPAPPQAAAAPVAPPAPTALFKSVCLDGSARLSRKWATPATFADLPSAARDMLIHGTGRIKPLTAADVPNPIYKIGTGDAFLIIPTPQSVEGALFADGCAVIWKGSDYNAARSVLPGGFADQNPGSFVSTLVDERPLSAGMSKGWTVLRLEGVVAAPAEN